MTSLNLATLVYGGPNAGKTAFGVGAFWNWKTNQLVTRDGKELVGRWICFGRESNPALNVPTSMVKRFTSPNLDNNEFVANFELYTTKLLAEVKKGNKPLDVLVIDGMSEFDLLYEEVFTRSKGEGDKFAKWDALLRDMFSIVQRLDPTELGCQVIVTARVTEKKKAIQGKAGKVIVAGDPEFINYDYYPSLRGQFRLHFPHYFNLVLYMENDMRRDKAGLDRSVHIAHLVRTGDFYVKNQWEYQWVKSGLENELINVDYWEVYDKISGLVM